MNDGFKLVEESFSQDAIVGIIHLHYIERQVLSSGILDGSKRYWKYHFAKCV
jgi:hypothetical protein